MAGEKLIELIERESLRMRVDSFGFFGEEVVWEFIEVETNILGDFIVMALVDFLEQQIVKRVVSLE